MIARIAHSIAEMIVAQVEFKPIIAAKENRAESPTPRGVQSDLPTKTAATQAVDGDSRCGCHDALDTDQHQCRGCGINSEDSKHQGTQVRINRSDPCSGPGVLVKGRTETLPAHDMLGDAANFRSKRKNRSRSADISFLPQNKTEAQSKSANEKQDLHVSVRRGIGRRTASRRSFRSDDGHSIYCERLSGPVARSSWTAQLLFGTRERARESQNRTVLGT